MNFFLKSFHNKKWVILVSDENSLKSEKSEESDTPNAEFEAQERIIAALPKLENNNNPEPQEQPSTRRSCMLF